MAILNKVLLGLLLTATLQVSAGLAANTSNDSTALVNTSGGEKKNDLPDDVVKLANETKNLVLDTLRNMTEYLPINIIYAETVGRNCNIIKYNKDYYSVPGLVIAALLFLVGVLFCFLGYRLIKINLFVLGFTLGGSFTYVLFLSLLTGVQGEWKIYVAVVLTVVVGISIGLLTICIYYIGLFLAGGSIGFLLVWILFSSIDIPFFQTHAYVPVLIAIAAGIVCGIVTLIFQKWLVIIGTSLIGSFLIAWSLDYYIELGQMVYYLLLFAVDRQNLNLCWFSWFLVGVFVLLAIAGLLVQILVTGRKYDHKKDFDGICCGLCKKCKRNKPTSSYLPLKSTTDD